MSTMTFYRQPTMGRPVAGSRGGDDDDDDTDPVDIPLRLRPINRNMDRLLFGNPRTTSTGTRPPAQRYFPPETSQWGGGGGRGSQWGGGGEGSQWGGGGPPWAPNGGNGSSSGVPRPSSQWSGSGSGAGVSFGRYNFGAPPTPPHSSFSGNFGANFGKFGGSGADDDAFGLRQEDDDDDDDDDGGDTDIPLRLKPAKPSSFDRLLSGGRAAVPQPPAPWVPPPPIRAANVPVAAPEPVHVPLFGRGHHTPVFDESAIEDDDDDDDENDGGPTVGAGGAGAALGAKPYRARGQTPNRRITQSELESLPDQELLMQALKALGYTNRRRDDDDDDDDDDEEEAGEGSKARQPEPVPELKLRRGRGNFGMEWGKA